MEMIISDVFRYFRIGGSQFRIGIPFSLTRFCTKTNLRHCQLYYKNYLKHKNGCINKTYKLFYNIILGFPQILAYLNSLQCFTYVFYLDSSITYLFDNRLYVYIAIAVLCFTVVC